MHRMQKIHRVLLVLLPAIALLLSACVAELTPQFSHQGRLLDDDGNPVPDGDYEVMYEIYNDELDGTGVYTETQTVTVEDGLFTTSLGMTGPLTPTIFAEPVWLQITVEGETLTPRQRLQGAPYAFSLTSGALIQGDESLDDLPGAALTVWNVDETDNGGFGLIALNAAGLPSPDQDEVAALFVNASGGSIDPPNPGNDTGSYGAVIDSNAYRGMLAIGGRAGDNSRGYFAAVFDSLSGISIEGGGSCIGCTMAYTARNVGDAPIRAGDFVVVDGVELDAEFNVPVMQVRRATGPSASVIGVATYALNRSPLGEKEGVRTGGYDPSGQVAAAGDYVGVAVQGLVQARAAEGAALQPGAAISVSSDGVIAAQGAGLARAMSAVDANGMVWVMVGGPAGGQ